METTVCNFIPKWVPNQYNSAMPTQRKKKKKWQI